MLACQIACCMDRYGLFLAVMTVGRKFYQILRPIQLKFCFPESLIQTLWIVVLLLTWHLSHGTPLSDWTSSPPEAGLATIASADLLSVWMLRHHQHLTRRNHTHLPLTELNVFWKSGTPFYPTPPTSWAHPSFLPKFTGLKIWSLVSLP